MNQKAGMYEYIDMDYLLAGTKMKLGLRDTSSEDMFLRDALNFCLIHKLKNFGTQTYIITQLPIEKDGNPRVKLPNGFIRLVKENPIVYVNAEGKSIYAAGNETFTNTYVWANGELIGSVVTDSPIRYGAGQVGPSITGNTFYKDSPFNDNLLINGSATVMDGYIYFSSNVKADYAKIAYLGAYFGTDGKVVIPSYCEQAMVNWAAKEWCTQQFAITGEPKFANLMNIFAKDYRQGKAIAKTTPLMPDSLEYEMINRMMNSLVQ
jgi:hypothetical protein